MSLCCSETSLNSKWVGNELLTTFKKEETAEQRILLPLDLDGYLRDSYVGRYAHELTDRLAADFQGWMTDPDLFDAQLERVVKALRPEWQTAPRGRRSEPATGGAHQSPDG